jgi:hypothetical protein
MHGIKGIIGTALLLMLATTSAFSAQEPSILLEKAIYSEETLGNLSDAINIYQQIVNSADTGRTTGALALYRLGMCYRKIGRENEALAAFSRLAQLYPEQKELITKSQMLDLRPAPWADGEILRLSTRSIGAKGDMGAELFTAESTQEAGKAAWSFKHIRIGLGTTIFYAAVADAATMAPISSRDRLRFMAQYTETRYTSDHAEVSASKDGTQTKNQIPLTRIVYDDAQILHLLRCLPLREGFQTTIPVLYAPDTFRNIKVSVVGREVVTVPAGTFDCFKVILVPDSNAQEETYWFSNDAHVYPVKSIQYGSEQELASIAVVGKNQPLRVEDKEYGLSLSVPPRWYFSRFTMGLSLITIAAPELESNVMVQVNRNKPDDTVSKLVDSLVSRRNEVNPYVIRPGTREAVTVAGLTGERLIADTADAFGEPVVKYMYVLANSGKNYMFEFQTDTDKFDKMKPEFESIVSSLSVQ